MPCSRHYITVISLVKFYPALVFFRRHHQFIIHKFVFAVDSAGDCDREVGTMRVIALILALITSVIGFAVSYDFAYRKVTGVLYAPSATMQSTTTVTTDR